MLITNQIMNHNMHICIYVLLIYQQYQNISMFKYIKLADHLKTTLTKNIQLKDLIYPTTDQPSSTTTKVDPRVAYSNLSLIVNNINKFDEMYQQLCKVMKKKKQDIVTNKYLLYVIVAEYFNVGKIVGGGKLKKIVMDNLAILPDIQVQSKINKQIVNIRLRATCPNKQQYHKWAEILAKYQPNPIVPNLFNLAQPQYSSLTTTQPSLRQTPACVIQSFSSTLPPFVLFEGLDLNKDTNKNKKFNIIDACSAPGNKTLQLSEYLDSKGIVYAFEKDERRYGTLCKNIAKYGANNVQCFNRNFLQTQPQEYPNVKLIMLDPSCSGSGMLINFTRDNNEQSSANLSFEEYVDKAYEKLDKKQQDRINSLKQFQLELLSHAAKYNPQRISYSTCSIHRQENEQVVKQFLERNPQYYIKPVNRNLSSYSCVVPGFGQAYKNCIRVDPRLKVSDGFFVCVFGRKKVDNVK